MTDTQQSEVERIGMTLAFFASVIKSGESWSGTCQRDYDAAQAALATLRPKPFADAANHLDERQYGAQSIWESSAAIDITVDDIRDARALLDRLNQTDNSEGEK